MKYLEFYLFNKLHSHNRTAPVRAQLLLNINTNNRMFISSHKGQPVIN